MSDGWAQGQAAAARAAAAQQEFAVAYEADRLARMRANAPAEPTWPAPQSPGDFDGQSEGSGWDLFVFAGILVAGLAVYLFRVIAYLVRACRRTDPVPLRKILWWTAFGVLLFFGLGWIIAPAVGTAKNPSLDLLLGIVALVLARAARARARSSSTQVAFGAEDN